MKSMHTTDNDRLTRGLDPEQRAQLGNLRDVDAALRSYDTPEPDSKRLFAQLEAYLPAPEPSPAPNKDVRYWFKLAQSQLSLVDGVFWWVSGLLLVLGALLVVAGGGTLAVIYALTSPLLAAAGTAYIFRPEARSLREFELLSAVNPLEMLYARLLLILAYNIVLALTLILFAWSQDAQIVLWRLLFIWFGPLVGLMGLALYVSQRWNALAGVIAPLLAWAGLLFVGWRETVTQNVGSSFIVDALFHAAGQSDTLLFTSLLALVAGVVAVWAAGRQVQETARL